MTNIRILHPPDQNALEAFLLPRLASSMFLVGNSRHVGLHDHGQRYEGTYAAAFEHGLIVGAAAHYWNGYLVMQAPVATVEVCRAAASASGRALGGLIGPADQVERVRLSLGITAEHLRMDEVEYLYTLDLAALRVPEALHNRELQVRPATTDDLELATDWRVQYGVETMNDQDTDEYRSRCRAGVQTSIEEGTLFILHDSAGQPLAQSGFNATLQEAVQVGGVYTPPPSRGRGYGRAVVAGSLQHMYERGVPQAVLYTGMDNIPAQKAYTAIGFGRVGDYRVMLLHAPLPV
jgi:uncharacterized protein